MALEFICSNEIIPKEWILIPEGATHYKVKRGKMNFYHVNPSLENSQGDAIKEIPFGAQMVSASFVANSFYINYGKIQFRNSFGNILKDCNGIKLWAKE